MVVESEASQNALSTLASELTSQSHPLFWLNQTLVPDDLAEWLSQLTSSTSNLSCWADFSIFLTEASSAREGLVGVVE